MHTPPPARKHARNQQGTGGRLRADILAAASRILETTGDDDAVTLRAVAREAGITAPAIYAHFADRDEIRFTVVRDTFTQLAATLQAAADGQTRPLERLRAVCHAYLDFAVERPHHYRLLFERHREARPADAGDRAPDVGSIVGADAFGVLLNAAAACIDTAEDPTTATTRVWIGLHGQATLQASLPWFPWPPARQLADDIADRMIGVGAS